MIDHEAEDSAGANNGTASISIDELIQATVKAITLNQANKESRTYVTNGELAALLPDFHGNGDDNVEVWLERINSVQEVYDVSDKIMQLVAVSKLCGMAKKWYLSRVEYVNMQWKELQEEMRRLFYNRPDRITLRKKFEARRWKRGEKFTEYFHEKILLANQAGIDEADLIDYVIDGFDDIQLRNQARMQSFTSLDNLLVVMKNLCDRNIHMERKPPYVRKPGVQINPSASLQESQGVTKVRCYNCNKEGHLATNCERPRRQRGTCYECGQPDHIARFCPKLKERRQSEGRPNTTAMVLKGKGEIDHYKVSMTLRFFSVDISQSIHVNALLDTGSPISMIKSLFIPNNLLEPFYENINYFGLNNSKLEILGIFSGTINIFDELITIKLYVVSDNTMSVPAILGRDYLSKSTKDIVLSQGEINFDKSNDYRKRSIEIQNKNNSIISPGDDLYEIMNIQVDIEQSKLINVNEHLDYNQKLKVNEIIDNSYFNKSGSLTDQTPIDYEMKIVVKHDQPFSFRPRRLSFYEKNELLKIINDLKINDIIRDSDSPYSSPIVLVKKKNGKLRLCVDYRELNKITIRDHFPIPLIEDQINLLREKCYFTSLDLKNGFHHVRVEENSIKYTSFVTPFGQYEFMKMPFGLCNGPSVFQRYINTIFKKLIDKGEIMIYLDDILIATQTFDEHIIILKKVLDLVQINSLELRLDKCKFLYFDIIYLGYFINKEGILPNPENINTIKLYPIPKNVHEVHRFLGLVSYFRKFISSFSTIAKPLYDLIRKDAIFQFNKEQVETFELLKSKLIEAPILAIYSPKLITELHCDACSKGYGAILMQKQIDSIFRPVFFFSKRTTDVESRYHSYELELLAIVYALERFRIYLQGLPFKIVTDCNSIRLALSKKEINPRINRWALVLQNYNFEIEHRQSNRMRHVDALSRINNIFILEENTFEQNIIVAQNLDPLICDIKTKLENSENKDYELHNGILYKKKNKNLLFYVPQTMETHVMHNCHDKMGHIGRNKTIEYISRVYWFPDLHNKVNHYIKNCLQCISYSPISGKPEGLLHNIPKGNKPFVTIHIDHYGPLEKTSKNEKFIFEIIDSFTKFIKLYAVRSTKVCEVISKLEEYFAHYSKPLRIISDRGSCFTSHEFESFMTLENITHIKIATATPRANGQIERVNRDLTPMLSKLSVSKDKWSKHLLEVEFSINNSFCRSIGTSPSKLLFGVNQRDLYDGVRTYFENSLEKSEPNVDLRNNAEKINIKTQNYNKKYYDRKHKPAVQYNLGDFVMIRNYDVTTGVNKKLIPQFKGPYEIKQILGNDRYLIGDIENFQFSNIPYSGVSSASNMRLWLC